MNMNRITNDELLGSSPFFAKPRVVRSLQSKYSNEFERDFKWYLKMRAMFNFDGSNGYYNKKGHDIIVYDKNGVSGKEAFYKWDSNGKILPTKHPNILHTLLKTKGSVNLHIKMYAEDRAKGLFTLIEFRAFCIKYKCPSWFKEAVERQKFKYYGPSNDAQRDSSFAFVAVKIITNAQNIIKCKKKIQKLKKARQ